MATTNDEGFSSLDPLGPEYGRINQPLLDSKGLSAFEGKPLRDNKINFPTTPSFFPTVPDINNLEQPQANVRETLVRRPMQKPAPNKKASYNDLVNAVRNEVKGVLESYHDKNTYGKIYSYDAGPDSDTFYKRYQAYGQETFDKIGFSPLRDNESLYNSRTTMLDDTARMLKHSFIPLLTSGIVAGPKSLYKMATGDFTGTDLEEARVYKEAAALGQSSKGGLGGFTNNMLMNYAYSAGIMIEAVAEEALGAFLAPETLGGSFFLTSANNLNKIGKLGKGLDLATDGYKAVNSTLRSVDSVSGARKFWEGTKKVGTSSFSPLQNTFEAVKAGRETIQKGEQLYNFTNLAKAYKTAGGFYKDVRNVNMALSEARLEAGMLENQVYDNLYNKHYRDTGEAPDNNTQYEMLKQAKEASLNTLKWNTALIYGSNAIVFPNIVGPKGGIPNFMRNTIKEVSEVGGGKFGKLGSVVYNQGKKEFQFRKNNFVNMVKDWGRQPVYKSLKGTIGYFKGNFTEGIQESLQEVISGANEKYYSDTFKSPALRAHLYSKGVDRYNEKSQTDYFKQELRNQFTGQGAETFASGFFMGMLATPLNAAIPNLSIGYNRIFNKEAFQEYKTAKSKIANDLVANLNAIDINDFLKSKTFNYGVQDLVSSIKQSGSKKQALDATDEAFLKQMGTVLETGSMDVFRNKINDLKQLTPEEFEDAVPNVPKGEGAKYQARLDGIIEKTKKVEERYNYFKEKFPNPVTESTLPPKGTPEYEDAWALYHGWNEAVNNAVFFDQTFDFISERKRDIMQKYVSKSPFKSMTQRDSEILFDYSKLTNEVAILKDEVESLEEAKKGGAKSVLSDKLLEDKKKRLSALENLAENTAKFRNFFNRYEKADLVRQEIQKQKGDAPVTDEEVDAVLDQFFGEFNDDNKVKTLEAYKDAYTTYLKAIAGVNDDYIFDKDIDESFDLLADHEKLNSEAKQIMKYINLLHDPGQFMEAAKRNRDWMKNLYKKRGQIYERIVSEELDIIESNALLNALAGQGVYISLDEFAEWKNSGTPPTEFYDHARKMIIPEGTELYNEYYSLFEQAAELREEKSGTVPESLDKELQRKLAELDSQMAAEIANVPQKEVRVDKQTLYPEAGNTMSPVYLYNNMESEDYADATYGGEFPLTFYKDEDGKLRLDNKDGEEIDPKVIAVDFASAQIYRMTLQPDPELVKPIKDRYENLMNKAKQEYANQVEEAKAEAQPSEEFVPVTADMELEDLQQHKELYNELYKLFNDKYLSTLSTEEDIELSEDPVKMRNAFTKFLQSDLQAKKLINEFNKNMKLEEVTKETGVKEDFEFIYQGKKINTANINTVLELRKMQRRFKNLIAEIEKEKEPTAAQITDKSNYMVIVNDLEKLIATRSKKGLTPELQEAIKKIEELKEKQGEIEQTPAGYVIDGETYRRVTTVIQELKGEKYEYTDAKPVAIAFYNNIGDQPLTNENIADFIQALRVSSLSGFSEFTYNELQKELESLVDQNLKAEELLNRVQQVVSEKTYEESRISGNYIDEQVKRLFDGTQPVEYNEELITEEAYNNLFGPQGFLTKLKQRVDNGEIYIVSQGIRVFDKELKIAGEIDLLVADTAGNLTIVDVKTGEKSKWDNFKKKDNKYSKMEDYQLQQAAYANLLDRMIGYNPKIALLPIQMTREKETGKIITASKPTSPTLLSTDFLISLDKAPIQEKIDSIIPRPETKVEPEITPAQIIPADAESSDDVESPTQKARTDVEAKKADIERKTTKVISSEIVEKGKRKGQTRTVTQTNSIEDVEGTIVSVTEYEAKVGDTAVTLGGRKMTFKEFKEEFPLDEDYEEILGDSPDLNDDTIITVRKVIRTPSNSRFSTVVEIFSPVLGGNMDITIKKDDTKYDAELAALEQQAPEEVTISDEVRYDLKDFQKDLGNANSIEQLSNLRTDLSLKIEEEKVSFEDLQEMSKLFAEKLEKVKSGEDVKVTPNSIKQDEQLISKTTIFGEQKPGQPATILVNQNDTVVVKSVDEKNRTMTISPLGETTTSTISFDKLNEMFILKDTVMAAAQQEPVLVTQEEKQLLNQSTDLVDTIISEKEKLNELENIAANKTIKDLDSELLNDLKC